MWRVWCEDQQERRRALFCQTQEVQGVISHDVSLVAIMLDPYAVHIQKGIKVLLRCACSPWGNPVIEFGACLAAPGVEIFADEAGIVARIVQVLHEGRPLQRRRVVEYLMMMGILSGQDGRSAGAAKRRGDVRSRKRQTLSENLGFGQRHVVHRVIALIISDD